MHNYVPHVSDVCIPTFCRTYCVALYIENLSCVHTGTGQLFVLQDCTALLHEPYISTAHAFVLQDCTAQLYEPYISIACRRSLLHSLIYYTIALIFIMQTYVSQVFSVHLHVLKHVLRSCTHYKYLLRNPEHSRTLPRIPVYYMTRLRSPEHCRTLLRILMYYIRVLRSSMYCKTALRSCTSYVFLLHTPTYRRSLVRSLAYSASLLHTTTCSRPLLCTLMYHTCLLCTPHVRQNLLRNSTHHKYLLRNPAHCMTTAQPKSPNKGTAQLHAPYCRILPSPPFPQIDFLSSLSHSLS